MRIQRNEGLQVWFCHILHVKTSNSFILKFSTHLSLMLAVITSHDKTDGSFPLKPAEFMAVTGRREEGPSSSVSKSKEQGLFDQGKMISP